MKIIPRPDLDSQLDVNDDGNRWYVVITAINWCRGISVQGNRVIQLTKFFESPPNDTRESFEAWQNTRKTHDVYRLIDEHFFLTAIAQAIDWCCFVKELYPELSCDIDAFCSDKTLKTTRNMREHNVEYVKGKGRSQKEYTAEIVIEDCPIPGSASGISDATGTLDSVVNRF